jgi:hypothetical protein
MFMSSRAFLAACLLLAAACKSESPAPAAPRAGSEGGGSGGAPVATGGVPGEPAPPAGTGTQPAPAPAAAPPEPAASPPASPPSGPSAATPDAAPAEPIAGGKALLVVGTIPLVGTDLQIRDALRARKLEVQEVKETAATVADAADKRLIVLSCSMQSGSFAARAAFADVKVPIIVLEHVLLPVLGMTTSAGHGFELGLTQLTIAATDPILTAGFPPGDLTVYARTQEMFWGTPGPGAVKIATVKGKPDRWVLFGYPAGAMMAGKPAPARRLQFFFAVHAPPPVTETYLNDNGLRLLAAAVDWSLVQ